MSITEFLKDMPSFNKDNFTLHSDLSARSSRRPSIYLPTEDIPSEVSENVFNFNPKHDYQLVYLPDSMISRLSMPFLMTLSSFPANHNHREKTHIVAVPAPAVE